jgi:hypothetical protein
MSGHQRDAQRSEKIMAGELHGQVTGEAIRTWLLVLAQARAGVRGQTPTLSERPSTIAA